MNPARYVAAASAWSVSLSPDATRMAYVSDRDGGPRLFVADIDGGNPKALDTGPEPVQEARWASEGERIALLVAPGGSPRTEVWVVLSDGSDLRRLTSAVDGASYLGPWSRTGQLLGISRTTQPNSGLCELVDLESNAVIPVALGGQPILLDIDAERRIALIRRGPRGDRSVWAVQLEHPRETELSFSKESGSSDLGRLSPSGDRAYLRSNLGRDRFALFAVQFSDGVAEGARLLAERADAELDDVILSLDGKRAALIWNREGHSECQILDLDSGASHDLLLPEPVAHGGSFSGDGRLLALTLEGPTHPRAVFVLNLTAGSFRRVTTQPSGWVSPSTTPMLERLRSDDGLEISGWLYRAAEGVNETPAAVVHLHGGPEAQARPSFDPLFQALAARGIAVFAANVRGSSGFGRAFLEADNRERRFGAIADVAACARHLFALGLATPRTLGCEGRSYGGYLTLAALVFHPELFAAGVDICGMADFATFYRDTEPWIARAAYPKYGHPESDAALLRELSPIHRFEALRAPLLVVHGENDTNVPVTESKQVVARARALGARVEFLLFPEEGHELVQRANRERFVTHTVEFLTRELLSPM
jgi:dipeptidyl aminopeptidase/acylaminoacyl peptidase